MYGHEHSTSVNMPSCATGPTKTKGIISVSSFLHLDNFASELRQRPKIEHQKKSMHHNSHLHVLWTTPTSFNSLLCPKKTAIPNPNLWLSTAKRPGEAKSLPLQRCEPTDDVQPNHSPSPRTPWRYRGVGSQEAASMSIFIHPPKKYIYIFFGGGSTSEIWLVNTLLGWLFLEGKKLIRWKTCSVQVVSREKQTQWHTKIHKKSMRIAKGTWENLTVVNL